jgi:sulfur-carrier protein
MTMLRLLYFAWVRERIGSDAETIELPADVADVGGVVAWLAERSEGHAYAFEDVSRLRYAADELFVDADTPIAHVRELAIFPPVTGG